MRLRLAVAAALCLPAAAVAQTSEGPFGGLFGRTPERSGRQFTILEARLSSGAQRDDVLLTRGLSPDQRVQDATIAGATGQLLFQRAGDRLQLDLQSSATYQEYFQSPRLGATSVVAAAVANAELTTRLSVDGAANYVYSPFFQMQPTFLGSPYSTGVLVPASPYVVSLQENHSTDVTAAFTARYTKSSTLQGRVSRRDTRFTHQPHNDFVVQGVRGTWTRRLGRDVAFRAGYSREEVTQQAVRAAEFVHEFVDLGLDLNKGVPLGRRWTMGFNTQTEVIRRRDTGKHYRLNGSVSASRRLSRTWYFDIAASRNTEFKPGFVEPLFSDTVTASVGGLLSPRTQLLLQASGGKGEFGLDGSGERFTTGSAVTQLNIGVTRRVGVFAQHIYYYSALPPGYSTFVLPQEVGRQTISIGITAWVPIITRVRIERDSR